MPTTRSYQGKAEPCTPQQRTAIRAKIAQQRTARPITTVHFEDHGQDFLEWDVDENGTVTDCRPFQASTWVGTTHVQVDDDGTVRGISNSGRLLQMRYRAAVKIRSAGSA